MGTYKSKSTNEHRNWQAANGCLWLPILDCQHNIVRNDPANIWIFYCPTNTCTSLTAASFSHNLHALVVFQKVMYSYSLGAVSELNAFVLEDKWRRFLPKIVKTCSNFIEDRGIRKNTTVAFFRHEHGVCLTKLDGFSISHSLFSMRVKYVSWSLRSTDLYGDILCCSCRNKPASPWRT